MLRNYFKIAFRNLYKSPVFSFINVAGLSLGIASFVLILQYIGFEKSVNRFHKNLPELHRVLFESKEGEVYDYSPPVLGPMLKQQFAEVNNYCRVAEGIANGIVTLGDVADLKTFKETRAAYADGSFFDMFTFNIHEGNASLLKSTNTAAISRSTAKKYFGNQSALEKVLTINNEFGQNLYTVVAVFDDFPSNSDLQYDLVLSMQTLANPANLHGSDWANLEGTSSYLTTYFQLTINTDSKLLEQKVNVWKKERQPDDDNIFALQPLMHLHLAPSLDDRQLHTGNLGFVYLLGGIALLILVIAWLNYINLSTAGALKRAKEVGLRKVVGANKTQLIVQFLGESFLLNLVGFAFAMVLVNLAQLFFNELIGINLSLSSLTQNAVWAWGLALLFMGTIASGAYTAFALSSFTPAQTLKGVFSKSTRGLALRKTLVVFQFSISVSLIAATFVMYRQLGFMKNENLGMTINQLLVINGSKVGLDSTYQFRKQSFQNVLAQASFIEGYCGSASVPTDGYNYSTSGITSLNPQPGDEKISYSIAYVDDRFFPTYEISLVAGKNFTYEDCNKNWQLIDKVIINERAASQLGFNYAEDAVGKKILWNDAQLEVSGVVKDYHHLSLKQAISPIIFVPQLAGGFFTVKLQSLNMQDNLTYLKKAYTEFFPGNPFEYFFVNDNYNRQYKTEQQYATIFTIASGLAIFIACLGLFGLATFTVEQRTKEIGIRKVMGASIAQIVTLLSKEFLLLVVLAIAVATPLAWWTMNSWLHQFAYRTEITVWIFTFAGSIAVMIALLTVGFQAIKAAASNPVGSLRNE
jgi:putative ABC transport system permease protein